MSEVILLIILKTHANTHDIWGCFDPNTFPFSPREMQILANGFPKQNEGNNEEWNSTYLKWQDQLTLWQTNGQLNYFYQPTMEVSGHEKVTIHIISPPLIHFQPFLSKL